ncbi:MAG: LysE family translocator [Alphaproteobacteria bacterium]
MDFNYTGLFIATYIFLLTPGVGVAMLLSRSLTSGFWISMFMGMGMILGDLTYATFVLTALSSVSHIIEPYLWYVRMFGVVYLMYIGIRQFFKKAMEIEQVKSKSSYAKEFTLGYIISVTNPKVVAFYIGFLPLFLPVNKLDFNNIIIALFVSFLASFLGLLTILWVALKLKTLLIKDDTAIIVNRILGGLIILLSIMLII